MVNAWRKKGLMLAWMLLLPLIMVVFISLLEGAINVSHKYYPLAVDAVLMAILLIALLIHRAKHLSRKNQDGV